MRFAYGGRAGRRPDAPVGMKSDRLVSLLLLLQARSPRSARELAEALEVSSRTIYRDVEALSLSGVPVYAERGSNGGIALAEGYRKAITQFSTEELHALFLAAADPLAELGVTGHARALDKLAGALPDLQRRAAQQARQRILLDHNRWYRLEQPAALLAVLRRAVWEDRQISIEYRDRTGALSERIVDAYGLVSKAGVWYFIARQQDAEFRTFRAERIAKAEERPTRFKRDGAFDLEAHWRASNAAMQRPVEWYEATLHCTHDSLERVMSFNDADVIAEDGDGKTLRIRFYAMREAVHHIAGWGSCVRVLDPPELLQALAQHARELLACYESSV
jgi:predicted DNA-binding transcriptional regulator YafY